MQASAVQTFLLSAILLLSTDCFGEETTVIDDKMRDNSTTVDPMLASILEAVTQHSLLDDSLSTNSNPELLENLATNPTVAVDKHDLLTALKTVDDTDNFSKEKRVENSLNLHNKNESHIEVNETVSSDFKDDRDHVEVRPKSLEINSSRNEISAAEETIIKHKQDQTAAEKSFMERIGLADDSNANANVVTPLELERKVAGASTTPQELGPLNIGDLPETYLDAWRPVWPFPKMESVSIKPTVRFPSITVSFPKAEPTQESVSQEEKYSIPKQPVTAYYFDLSSALPTQVAGPLYDLSDFTKTFNVPAIEKQKHEELYPTRLPQDSSVLESSLDDDVYKPFSISSVSVESTPTLTQLVKSISETAFKVQPTAKETIISSWPFITPTSVPERTIDPLDVSSIYNLASTKIANSTLEYSLGSSNDFEFGDRFPVSNETSYLVDQVLVPSTLSIDNEPSTTASSTGDLSDSIAASFSNTLLTSASITNSSSSSVLTTNRKEFDSIKSNALSRIPLWQRISQKISTSHDSLSSSFANAPSSDITNVVPSNVATSAFSSSPFENDIPIGILSPGIFKSPGWNTANFSSKKGILSHRDNENLQNLTLLDNESFTTTPVLESSFQSSTPFFPVYYTTANIDIHDLPDNTAGNAVQPATLPDSVFTAINETDRNTITETSVNSNVNINSKDFTNVQLDHNSSSVYSTLYNSHSNHLNFATSPVFTNTVINIDVQQSTFNSSSLPVEIFVDNSTQFAHFTIESRTDSSITSPNFNATSDNELITIDYIMPDVPVTPSLINPNFDTKLSDIVYDTYEKDSTLGIPIGSPIVPNSFDNSTVNTNTNEVYLPYDEPQITDILDEHLSTDSPYATDEVNPILHHIPENEAVPYEDITVTKTLPDQLEADDGLENSTMPTIDTPTIMSEDTVIPPVHSLYPETTTTSSSSVNTEAITTTTSTTTTEAIPTTSSTTGAAPTTSQLSPDTMPNKIEKITPPPQHEEMLPAQEAKTPSSTPTSTPSSTDSPKIESSNDTDKVIVVVEKSPGSEPQLHLVQMLENGTNSTRPSPFVKAAVSYDIREFCQHKRNIHALLGEWINIHLTNATGSKPYEIEVFYQPDCKNVYLLEEEKDAGENKTNLYFYVKENGEMNPNLTRKFPKNPTTLEISKELDYLKRKILHLELVNAVPTQEDLLIEEAAVGTSIVVIVVVISLLIILIGASVLGFVLIKRRKTAENMHGRRCTPAANDAYSLDSVSVFYHSIRRKSRKRASNKSLKSYLNQGFEDPNGPTRPLNFAKLTQVISDNEGLHDEFSNIPTVMPKYDEMPRGVEDKNRYANVIPVPETRILLNNNSPCAEYINANSVHGPRAELRYYIATQAPLDSTVADFWQMIWEQESKVIVMLTDFVEKGIDKCADYLPPSETLDCHRVYGEFQITLKSRDLRERYVVSVVQIKNLENNLVREIAHMWFTGWPHTGVPNDEKSFISFIFDVRTTRKQLRAKGPIIVHCSPGTGRTGTYIACDLSMRQFDDQKIVDIPKTVFRIRRERAGAVQTKEQYAFIYRVVYLYAAKLNTGNLDSF